MVDPPPPPDPDLASHRAAIDAVDQALLELLARRRSLVAELFAHKRGRGLPLVDPARERELIAERRAAAERLGVPGDLAERVFRAVLEGSHAQAEADVRAPVGEGDDGR